MQKNEEKKFTLKKIYSYKFILYTVIKLFLLISALVLFIGPFVILIINSFKTNNEILENPIKLPSQLNFNNFTECT